MSAPWPVLRPDQLEQRAATQKWLVEGLWANEAVGIIGGEPKCGKTFLALDIAVAVAAGTPCLRRFAVHEPGPVLLFAAEDAQHDLRHRLEGITAAAGVDFNDLDIHVIDTPVVRLDQEASQAALSATVEQLQPRLLVLDPLVRMHRIDENAATEMAHMLNGLRTLQRRFGTAVLVVHHARKGGHARGGQALRGSSELHGWLDALLYLRRRDHRILLEAEHRAAPGLDSLSLSLVDAPPVLALAIDEGETVTPDRKQPPCERVLAVLGESTVPLSQRVIRKQAGMRASAVSAALEELVRGGRIERGSQGYSLVTQGDLLASGAPEARSWP